MVQNPLHGVESYPPGQGGGDGGDTWNPLHGVERRGRPASTHFQDDSGNPLHGVESTSAKTPVCSNSS